MLFGESWYEKQYKEYRDKYNEQFAKYLIIQEKYIANLKEYNALHARHRLLMSEWNGLIDRINQKGGEPFLSRGSIFPPSEPKQTLQFSQDEIKQLIILCHPDKHSGRHIAHELTVKLLAMKKKK